MRGDRPRRLPHRFAPTEATPHARGSTRAGIEGNGLRGGYPACAGIDLAGSARRRQDHRLPRMRGDRPVSIVSMPVALLATPHARGSTSIGAYARYTRGGYPACAGIDLTFYLPKPKRGRLPRMRGDRPGHLRRIAAAAQATPHARGSTLPGVVALGNLEGYPACAGIDLWRRPWCPSPARLPRMRGDRPRCSSNLRPSKQATPHARGSTSDGGYPACAGIDLSIEEVASVIRRLPRMRGDRPAEHDLQEALRKATPHARGSTSTSSKSGLQ